jgi:hypothetical protein
VKWSLTTLLPGKNKMLYYKREINYSVKEDTV